MQREFGSPCDLIALEWSLLRRNDPNLPANPTLDEIGDMCLFGKKLTFRDFQDRMDQTARLIREKAGNPRHDFPTFLTGNPKAPPSALLHELIQEQSQIPLLNSHEYGVDRENEASQKKGAGRGSANYCNKDGQNYLAGPSQPIIPHPTQTFGNGFMEESPYGCPSSYKPRKRFCGGERENEQRSAENSASDASIAAYENAESDMENDF
jgi:hypothetical protein